MTNPAGETQPITRIRAGELAENVVVVGDPARVAKVAQRLDGAREIAANREYLTVTGSYRGVPVSVSSHGVGAAGAAVAFTELCRAGAKRIVRAGTAGGMQLQVTDGAVVVATGAVRDEGITPRLVPLGFPAVADPSLTLALLQAVSGSELHTHHGIVLTSDLFYPAAALGDDLEMWSTAGCVAVEMELAALLIIAAQHGVAAGGVFAIDGNPLATRSTDMAGYNPFREIVDRAVDTALAAALAAATG